MTNDTQSKQTPIYKKQLPKGIGAAVFEKQHDGRTYRSVSIQRSYRNRDGEWKRMTIYLDHEHIPFMQEALEATWKFLNGDLSLPETDATEDTTVDEPISEDAAA